LGSCVPNDAGWANVDMDSLGATNADGSTTGQSISIEFKSKPAHTDEDVCTMTSSTDCPQGEGVHTVHGATQGDFTYQPVNGRYVLPCKQAEGEKTIRITVSRPKELNRLDSHDHLDLPNSDTVFGAEWVKAYEKDSWMNVTNEYEPYTFNDFGSKIPLQEFRATTADEDGRTIVIDAKNDEEMNVFMVMDEVGDYEIRYGNPNLKTTTGKWITVEFKKHQLRVGSPWAQCDEAGGSIATTAESYSSVGTIIPVYLGNPALNLADYQNVEAVVKSAFTASSAIPTKIILPVFTPANDGADRTLKPGATTWTEGTRVVNGAIAKDDRNPLEAKNSAYHCTQGWKDTDTLPVESHPACSLMEYHSCYAAGASCPLDHDVCKPEYCELQRWREIIDMYQAMTNVQVLGLVETKDPGGTPRPKADIEEDIKLYKDHVPAISGFYFNEVGTPLYPTGTGTHVNTLLGISSDKLKTCPKKYPFRTQVAAHAGKICFATQDEATGTASAVADSDGKCGWCCLDGACAGYAVGCTEQQCAGLGKYFVAFGVGEPLFDTGAVVAAGTPDVWITLNDNSSKLGVWTPYSWFSSLSNGYQFSSTKWGAIVTDVTDTADYGTAQVTASPATESILTKLFDRGYGYIYMTTESLFSTTSSHLDLLITGIHKKTANEVWAPSARRLSDAERAYVSAMQTRDNGVSVTRFECDDTLFKCQPVCVETMGVTRSTVSAEKCTGFRPDECSCRCLYDAHWTCEDNTVVCKATITGAFEQTVGDLVCLTRGTPKPRWNAAASQRKAGECGPLPVLREERPTQACLAQHAAFNADAQAIARVHLKLNTMDVEIMATAGVPTLLAAMTALYM
jgi:hypothetical protein